MALSFAEVANYLYIGLILYLVLDQLLISKRRWYSVVILMIALAIVGYLLWSSKQEESSLEEESEEVPVQEKGEDLDFYYESPEVEQNVFVQDSFRKQRRRFELAAGAYKEEKQLTYKDFKEWYLSPDFLEQYTEAIREALKVKHRRLLEVKTQYLKDLKALKAKEQKEGGLTSILSVLDKSQDIKMIESTITEINSLLKEIRSKQNSLSVETTRRGLISALTNRKNGIDSLTGREDIKDFLALQLFTFAQNPRIFFSNFQNMAIYGSSGVGKTKLAQVIGHVYASSGILTRSHVHVITKQSLTTAYVNESARITRKILLANLEGVVFIDEAYDMTPPPTILGQGIDHGHEAITEIVNFIDKMIGLSIIIVAGYEKPMEERFMKANEGLPRRFPHKLVLRPYSDKELTSILIHFILETCPDLDFDETHGDFLYTVISYINQNEPDAFKGQAGDMLNLSGFISRAIYGSFKSWEDDYEEILLSGINAFLSSKDISVVPL